MTTRKFFSIRPEVLLSIKQKKDLQRLLKLAYDEDWSLEGGSEFDEKLNEWTQLTYRSRLGPILRGLLEEVNRKQKEEAG